VFGVSDPAALTLSDDVCSGLQIVEHMQDVSEDLKAGRIYLPATDMAMFGCTEDDLAQPSSGEAARLLVVHECLRARSLLRSGEPLVALLRGQSRLAVAGFVAGGRAALDSIESVGGDVLGHRCRPSRRRVVAHMIALLVPRRRRIARRAPQARGHLR
jgi:phytoene/squalene synthetase